MDTTSFSGFVDYDRAPLEKDPGYEVARDSVYQKRKDNFLARLAPNKVQRNKITDLKDGFFRLLIFCRIYTGNIWHCHRYITK